MIDGCICAEQLTTQQLRLIKRENSFWMAQSHKSYGMLTFVDFCDRSHYETQVAANLQSSCLSPLY